MTKRDDFVISIYHAADNLFGEFVEVWQCPNCGDNVSEKTNKMWGYRLAICAKCKSKIDWKK